MSYTIRKYIASAILVLSIVSCSGKQDETAKNRLLAQLNEFAASGKVLYGHHDTYLYGHSGWKSTVEDSTFSSDIYQVCGKFPAIFSSDLGMIEHGNNSSLDNNPFTLIRKTAIHHHNQGGIVTFSWHPDSPLTRGTSWDVSEMAQKTVKECLPGGSCHEEFTKWLCNIADFFETLTDSKGNRIPFIFRPWHEHTGNWFWWGSDYCLEQEYKELWEMTYNYMVSVRGLDNIIWAYSAGNNCSEEEFMARYPGDKIVDIIGFDSYEYTDNSISDWNERLESANKEYIESVRKQLEYTTRIAKKHEKILALTECGFEGVPYPKWWTEVLCQAIEGYPIAYVLNWRNACDVPTHFYGPWKGSETELDFKKFAQMEKIVFLEDL